tara:strand:+ start:1484 stop:1942 length:459 start_codon:yes stop_codon:yes gene_type:complete
MANATRMQTAQSTTIYHRMDAANDAAQHDTPTSEALAKGLGSSADFQLDSDDNITYATGHQVVSGSRSALSGATACTGFLYIKHTGFTTSAKDTASASSVKLDIGGANECFTIFPGESIMLHHLGSSADALSDWNADPSSDDVYLEIVCGAL